MDSSVPYATVNRRERSRKLAQRRRDTYKSIMDELIGVSMYHTYTEIPKMQKIRQVINLHNIIHVVYILNSVLSDAYYYIDLLSPAH